jgi:transcriptional regulator with XRE-family HTH domain
MHRLRVDGEKVRVIRESRLLTREDVAKQLQVSYSTIQSLEIGRRTPRLKTLQRLCKVLKVHPDQILHSNGHAVGKTPRVGPKD